MIPSSHPPTIYHNAGQSTANTIALISPGPSASHGHETHRATSIYKKRKIDRACDACRRRKTKCDGPKLPDNICTNCLQANKPCTYLEASKPRGPPKAYVTGLEDRMEKLEALLTQLRPDEDFSTDLGPPVVRGSWQGAGLLQLRDEQASLLSSSSSEIGPAESKFASTPRRAPHPLSDPPSSPGSSSSEDHANFDIIEIESLSGLVQKLTLRGDETVAAEPPSDAHARFHGKSSSVGLVEATQRYKMMHLLDAIEGGRNTFRGSPDSTDIPAAAPSHRRPEFWTMPRVEREWEDLHMDCPEVILSVLAEFPPQDLASELVHLYFLHVNCRFPLLHRPTFDRQWKEKLHHTNVWFAAVCLGLFAVASRWSNDSRVIPEGATTDAGETDWWLAGWRYFEMGKDLFEVRRSLFYPATLFEIQSYSLYGLYVRGTPHFPLAWTIVGIGIRKAQDVGAHRKKVYQNKPSVDEELWKRAFWCLVVFDRVECALLGRGCGVGEEDFDVEFPLEVDDEYWETEDPAMNFKQPQGVPAKVCAFNYLIKLSRVMAFAIKTLYAVDRSKILFGLSPATWRKEVLEQMDTALKQWVASLPEHLNWSKQQEGSPYMIDAATLQATYHLIQMFIYQPLIPPFYSPSSSSEPLSHQTLSPSLSFSALDKCVDAARACARISETQTLRGLLAWPIHIYAAQACSVVLLVKIWDLKVQEMAMRAQGVEDIKPPILQVIEPLIADVKVFVRVLEWAEPRWGFIAPFLKELRQCLPGTSGFSAISRYSQPALRAQSHISDHNIPLPPSNSGPPSLHSPFRLRPWEEPSGLARFRLLDRLPAPFFQPGPPYGYDSSQQLHRTAGCRDHSGVPPTLTKSGNTHTSLPPSFAADFSLIDDSLSRPSPFDQMRSFYPNSGPTNASPLPFPPHFPQGSLPYLSSAMRQALFPPPHETDLYTRDRHRAAVSDGDMQYGMNMVSNAPDSHQPVMGGHPRVSRPSSLR
ncbi:hypothetical protein D9615_002218 [Tricholomella constricta]|uniref:Zn(2)-C6 fungal-type domain-containing protein n=1 Tax=Tricholomella constricta TaxID=117010 RepID=A0A8H5MA25_9AGAR|nr:hypothetical protein D9615_002218 [Tricholomella constricta]